MPDNLTIYVALCCISGVAMIILSGVIYWLILHEASEEIRDVPGAGLVGQVSVLLNLLGVGGDPEDTDADYYEGDPLLEQEGRD